MHAQLASSAGCVVHDSCAAVPLVLQPQHLSWQPNPRIAQMMSSPVAPQIPGAPPAPGTVGLQASVLDGAGIDDWTGDQLFVQDTYGSSALGWSQNDCEVAFVHVSSGPDLLEPGVL